MAYARISSKLKCYICGMSSHLERWCPYNHIYGQYDSDECKGECPPGPGQHRITSKVHRKFLRRFMRVSNLPPGFMEWNIPELFDQFGPLLMWDVPRYVNDICHCKSETRMRFAILVFKKRADGERAIDELNGYEVAGHKLRIDWVYPSCV
ncbi:hypothetical protein HU200_007065 [Digitaria exilis]|uniref:RRM domain-containing protein n=1 Tax=Digitaria exilis TaxID=1010633 RepID=A0A835FP67_9POAL|nr:hypothetical protein HU200_033761 [Digitaria exilis]KAF8768973.1 hypothetical protein HU200_007065 [Digitaria exilis]